MCAIISGLHFQSHSKIMNKDHSVFVKWHTWCHQILELHYDYWLRPLMGLYWLLPRCISVHYIFHAAAFSLHSKYSTMGGITGKRLSGCQGPDKASDIDTDGSRQRQWNTQEVFYLGGHWLHSPLYAGQWLICHCKPLFQTNTSFALSPLGFHLVSRCWWWGWHNIVL